MRSYPYVGEPTVDGLAAYRRAHGGTPAIFTWDSGIFAVAPKPKRAALALAFARDGARIVRLAAAFGGVEYLTDAARRFIENWEVESYRSRQL